MIERWAAFLERSVTPCGSSESRPGYAAMRQRTVKRGRGGRLVPHRRTRAGEEPFDGVEVHNPIFEVIVSEHAFDRLMARFFRALHRGAAGVASLGMSGLLTFPWVA
jgi:hypothetical protein